MSPQPFSAELPLPKSWTKVIKSAVLHVISLAQLTIASAQAKAINNKEANPFQVEIERLGQQVTILQDQLRISRQRMRRVPAHLLPNGWGRKRGQDSLFV